MAAQPDAPRGSYAPVSFSYPGGGTGVLLVHGFGGSTVELRPLAGYLNDRGLTVHAPLLPGHGTTLDDLNRRRWQEWTECAERALDDLLGVCQRVFVCGFSAGALVVAYLAARRPEVAGVVLLAPCTWLASRLIRLAPLAKWVLPSMRKTRRDDLVDPSARERTWSYPRYAVAGAHELLKLARQARRALPRVVCPLLVIGSTRDSSVHPESAQRTYELAGSPDKELVVLHDSGHCLTVDAEWQTVAERTAAFVQRRADDEPEAGAHVDTRGLDAAAGGARPPGA